ncbi:MAG: Uma2 family endonuclease [Chloroflexia bacterium]
MSTKQSATIEDLYSAPDDMNAELVNGELVLMVPTGVNPKYAGDEIYASLREYARRTRRGRAVADGAGFLVNLPNRKSFSPDAAFYQGTPDTMKFFDGAPIFAAEVRSANDYGQSAEREMADKRADYFAAGTIVVWYVDLLSEDVVRVYRSDDPQRPTAYRRGEIADAEPALPDWTMPVNDLFFG